MCTREKYLFIGWQSSSSLVMVSDTGDVPRFTHWISFLDSRKGNDVNLWAFSLVHDQNKVGHSHQPHTASPAL